MSDQHQLAVILADELVTCGHDVSGLDILDALATSGMELIQPPDPSTAEHYHDALTRGLDEAES